MSPDEAKKLCEAILSAFPSKSALEQTVFFELGEKLDAIIAGGSLRDVAFQLVAWATANGKDDDLIAGLRKANPGNPVLRAFDESRRATQRAPTTAPAGGLAVDATSGIVALSPQLRGQIVATLLRLPPVLSFEGRSALLTGIPWAPSLNRSPTNAWLDLEQIIDQLAGVGRLATGAFALQVFLENAASYVPEGSDVDAALRSAIGQMPGTRSSAQ